MTDPTSGNDDDDDMSSPAAAAALAGKLRRLCDFSACDVSDALLKLKVPGAGFLADMRHVAPGPRDARHGQRVAGPAATVLFVPKSASPEQQPQLFGGHAASNIPKGQHYVDLTRRDSIMVLSQPAGQQCAVLGGIMAQRMGVCGALGIVVDGRVRDLTELQTLSLPIWSQATSTVGAGAEAKPWMLDVPITTRAGLTISPGDVVLSDPAEGVVAIPAEQLDAVLELMPRLTAADDRVKADVAKGVSVQEAFARHRSAL